MKCSPQAQPISAKVPPAAKCEAEEGWILFSSSEKKRQALSFYSRFALSLCKNLLNMKINYNLWGGGALLLLALSACNPRYKVVDAEGGRVTIDSVWDATPDAEAAALLAPYKAGLDSVMNHVVATAAQDMEVQRPESLLSNLVADVLRQSATSVLGRPADMGLVNMGGIRTSLSAGDVTTGNIYEILPFENSLCVLTVKGSVLTYLFENIAGRGGEGVSGVQLEISRDGRLLSARVGGEPVQPERLYTVATVDYLAEGNDGMVALPQAEERQCPAGATLRGLFMEYAKQQTEQGKPLTSRLEGRIVRK